MILKPLQYHVIRGEILRSRITDPFGLVHLDFACNRRHNGFNDFILRIEYVIDSSGKFLGPDRRFILGIGETRGDAHLFTHLSYVLDDPNTGSNSQLLGGTKGFPDRTAREPLENRYLSMRF